MKITEFEIKLVERKIRPTSIQLFVLEALHNRKTAISLFDLELVLGKSDRVRLFRALETFQGNRLVYSIDDGTGLPKYALCEDGCKCNIKRDLHVHFHCRVCVETNYLPKSKISEINLSTNLYGE